MNSPTTQRPADATASERQRIDLNDDASVEHWTATFAVTRSQLEESVGRVGSYADEVELDLKGSRSSTIAEQVVPGNTVD